MFSAIIILFYLYTSQFNLPFCPDLSTKIPANIISMKIVVPLTINNKFIITALFNI